MSRRKYSNTFIDYKISQIDELNEKVRNEVVMLPNFLEREEHSWLKKQVMEYVKHRVDRAYVQGFWYGWTLKEGDPN